MKWIYKVDRVRYYSWHYIIIASAVQILRLHNINFYRKYIRTWVGSTNDAIYLSQWQWVSLSNRTISIWFLYTQWPVPHILERGLKNAWIWFHVKYLYFVQYLLACMRIWPNVNNIILAVFILETYYASGRIICLLYYSSSVKTGRIIRRTIRRIFNE